MSRKPRPDRLTERQAQAEKRNNRWASLTGKQQLAALDRDKLTATKQRIKIAAKIEAERNAEAQPVKEEKKENNKPHKSKKSQNSHERKKSRAMQAASA